MASQSGKADCSRSTAKPRRRKTAQIRLSPVSLICFICPRRRRTGGDAFIAYSNNGLLIGDEYAAGSPGARMTIMPHELTHKVNPPAIVPDAGLVNTDSESLGEEHENSFKSWRKGYQRTELGKKVIYEVYQFSPFASLRTPLTVLADFEYH
ncbi:MAG TPA: hypothetical protein VKW06_21145 [Candidatus Angelobacter sp.]|nr:hypothetical protein [Candidatus Angelobacter sp.]